MPLKSAPIAVSSALILCGTAWAQEPAGAFNLKHDVKADAVVRLGGETGRGESLLADLDATVSAETITESGRRFGAVLGLRAQRDPQRRGMARRTGDCPPALADCPDTDGLAQAGLLTGFHGGGDLETNAVRAELETAYLYVKTGLFEVRAGRGEGAAMIEAEPVPGAFRLVRADGPLVDPDGIALASTRNDLSTNSAKLTVQTRRLVGFRAAASFTPRADLCGVDACRLESRPGGPAVAEIEHVAEAGVSFDHLFRSSQIRWSGALTASRGEVSGPLAAAFEDPWALGARAGWARGDWSAGLAVLQSNDGLDGGRYTAWSASAAYEQGAWLTALEWAAADSDAFHASGWTVQLGTSRLFDNGALAGFGVRHGEQSVPEVESGARISREQAVTALFAEAGLRF